MKQQIVFILAFVLAASSNALAQEASPSPAPDPHFYTDPAMNYTAPPEAVLAARTYVPLSELNDQLQPVAMWLLDPGKENMRSIQIQMESYNGSVDEWESEFESQAHNQLDGVLIRNKTAITLQNGMPAYFVEAAYGSGFDSRKEFAIVWADGQRGIVLAESGRLGDASRAEAMRVLTQATAVRYPTNQP
ncbi:MAG TPA: hypothetical protein VGX91_07590 [Candidatus Cybelea sp.]|jgi:hypothetical protein|nr:hypothetical protein [Candidatus Cybelea sp.]